MTITQEQRDERRQGIGSSDAAAIMGFNPYRQARHVWEEKVHGSTFEGNFATKFGDHVESFIADHVAETIGLPLVEAPTYVRGILRANVDRQVLKPDYGQPIVECKATNDSGWGEPGTDTVPDSVYCQVQHQMHCAQAPHALVARLTGNRGWKVDIYRVEYERDAAELIERVCTEFWANYVIPQTPPPLDESHASTDGFLASIERNSGAVKPVSKELAAEYLDAKRALAEADAYAKYLRTKIMLMLDDATVGDCPGYKVALARVNKTKFDLESFEKAMPELAEKYRVPSGHWRLDVQEVK